MKKLPIVKPAWADHGPKRELGEPHLHRNVPPQFAQPSLQQTQSRPPTRKVGAKNGIAAWITKLGDGGRLDLSFGALSHGASCRWQFRLKD